MPSLGMVDEDPWGDRSIEEWEERLITSEEQCQQEEAQRIWYKDRKPGDYLPI